VEKGIYSLELFHGPTMAFKDVGAVSCHVVWPFSIKTKRIKTQFLWLLLETGGAVASGFLGVAGVEVIILYPSGR
jgi:threonine synthase